MKRYTYILLGVLFLIALPYIIFLLKYMKALNDDSKRWYKTEYLDKGIQGVLTDLVIYKEKPYEVLLTIDDINSEFDINYGVTCVSDEFIQFVETGYKVYKIPGDKMMKFCRDTTTCGEFELYTCNDFQ